MTHIQLQINAYKHMKTLPHSCTCEHTQTHYGSSLLPHNGHIHHVVAGGGGRPTFVTSQGGWPAAGGQLQMLRTVLTQAGSKPGQTTILLAQPSGQCGSSLVTSTGQLLQAATVKTVPQSGLKNAPLYARIITPPPGVRLVGMRANQGAVVGQVTSLQNVGMVRAIGKATEPVSLATSNVVVTSSPADGATGTHPEQK